MANIETTTIPGTDLNPSRVGLGTWAIGGWMWGGSDDAQSIRTIQEAVDRARARGYKVASLHLRVLSPLPDEVLHSFITSVNTLLVPECNYSGQLANLLGAQYSVQPIRVNKFGGIPFTAGDILRAIEEVC